MEVFIVQDGRIAVTPEALLLTPFKKIWNKYDTDEAILRFTYIEFMCSYKKTNPFIGYQLKERENKILEYCMPTITNEQKKDITSDKDIIKAMSFYDTVQLESSPSLRLHMAAEAATDKMIGFFTTFDLSAKNLKTGTLLYKPADITRALKDVNDVIRTLTSTRQKVIEELAEDSKGKGNRSINYFEKSKKDR